MRAGNGGGPAVCCYPAGGLAGVPHSAQNFAVAVRSALQLVQCLAIGVPHESQNFASARTWFWQLPQATVPAAGAAAGAGAGGGACCAYPWLPPAKVPGGGG